MADYQDDTIITLDWDEHIRMRPGMYIGKLGNGSSFDDGIYVLLKEVTMTTLDNIIKKLSPVVPVVVQINRIFAT